MMAFIFFLPLLLRVWWELIQLWSLLPFYIHILYNKSVIIPSVISWGGGLLCLSF